MMRDVTFNEVCIFAITMFLLFISGGILVMGNTVPEWLIGINTTSVGTVFGMRFGRADQLIRSNGYGRDNGSSSGH